MNNNNRLLSVIIGVVLMMTHQLYAQTGYHDAPYIRYEANEGTLANGAAATAKSFDQTLLQSEASGQVCVDLSSNDASVSWPVTVAGDGLVVRYSVPDTESGVVNVLADGALVGTLNLTSYYSWEYLSTNGNTNNQGVSNPNPKMRFDEVRIKLAAQIPVGGILQLVRVSGNVHIDFAELEPVPAAIPAPSSGAVVTYSGDGSNLQAFIDGNGGKTIYLPEGLYSVNRELYFGVANTKLQGAGMWYTQINFTNAGSQGGLRANASAVSFSDLYLTTVRNSRSNSYNGINGVFTTGSVVKNVWTEHFECGAWIAQYNTGSVTFANDFTVSDCRFRNSYADGINLCKGTSNAIVEHCNFRNNGDDDMAIWSAEGLECRNNTFRFNTSENCWRASGCAIYGGYNNKAQNLLIRDNLEAGIRVNNSFPGVGFNDNGMHEFSDITIIGCGTFNDLFKSPVGAIDIACNNTAGTRVKNVRFYNINIIDSKNDAIYINKKNGEGFYNLVFENISVDGTGKEYPGNDIDNKVTWGRGYGILFVGNPAGNGTYCNMTYTGRGGNANTNVNSDQKGAFSWIQACIPPITIQITSDPDFGVCDDHIVFEATATPPTANTTSYVEFFVDNTSIGSDHTAPYTMEWNNATAGKHTLKATAHYTPSNTTSTSLVQTVTVANGVYTAASAPLIDGSIDAVWNDHAPFSLDLLSVGTISGPADLSANFKIMRDASYLYILADVTDDNLSNDGGDSYNNDQLELYIDMGNDKAGNYGANDFSYNFLINDPAVHEAKHSPASLAGVTFAQGAKTGGYIMEIRISWSTLKGAPAAGDLMGFDLHVDDDDNGGTRNAKIAWNDAADNAWQSTGAFGTLQIAGCTNPYTPLALSEWTEETKDYLFYPNPFAVSGTLSLASGHGESFTVNISDLNGKTMWTGNLEGNATYTVGEQLPAGMYILEVFNGKTKQTSKLIKL